jgi:hypothetical protein
MGHSEKLTRQGTQDEEEQNTVFSKIYFNIIQCFQLF